MSAVKKVKSGVKKNTPLEHICEIIWDLLDIVVSLYMVALMVVLPLYSTETGYRSIGTDKCMLFRSVSLLACKAVLPLTALYLLSLALRRLRPGSRDKRHMPSVSITDLFALLYLAAVVCSYLHSSFREETEWGDAFYGVSGWYLGLLTQLLFLGIYFAVSRLWQRKDWLIGLWIPTIAVVTLLGYLNRFGIYPLEMKASGPQYISTIGNINWYCGYIVTILSGVAYYLWQRKECAKKKWMNIAAILFLGVGLASLVTQGSSSGIVTLLLLLGVFYLLSMSDEEKLQRFFGGCVLLSGVCIFTWLIRQIWPQAINYIESTTDMLTMSPLPFLMLGVSLLCWFLVCRSRRAGRFRAGGWTLLGLAAWTGAGVAVAVYVILLAVNTRYPGSIGSLAELETFTFNASWGSNRGITWTAGLTCFLDQDLAGKLVGVGPDTMAIYIRSGADLELKQMVEDYFGRLMLTNAHNEWLTVLVNEGLLGAVGYIGLMVTAICRYLRAGRKDALAGAMGMGILAYTLNNIFSFQQVMGTSAVFLLLGIGEACLRHDSKV